MTTTTLEQTRTAEPETSTSDGGFKDRPEMAHIVLPKSVLVDAIVFKIPVTALCGHTWVPGRSPKGLPVCPPCKEAFEAMHGDLGDVSGGEIQ